MKSKIQNSKSRHFALIALVAGVALIGIYHPFVDLAFRIAFSLIAFAIVVFAPREYLKALWFWAIAAPLLALHCALLMTFNKFVREVNIWLWGLIIISEMILVSVIILRVSPEERAIRRSTHAKM